MAVVAGSGEHYHDALTDSLLDCQRITSAGNQTLDAGGGGKAGKQAGGRRQAPAAGGSSGLCWQRPAACAHGTTLYGVFAQRSRAQTTVEELPPPWLDTCANAQQMKWWLEEADGRTMARSTQDALQQLCGFD